MALDAFETILHENLEDAAYASGVYIGLNSEVITDDAGKESLYFSNDQKKRTNGMRLENEVNVARHVLERWTLTKQLQNSLKFYFPQVDAATHVSTFLATSNDSGRVMGDGQRQSIDAPFLEEANLANFLYSENVRYATHLTSYLARAALYDNMDWDQKPLRRNSFDHVPYDDPVKERARVTRSVATGIAVGLAAVIALFVPIAYLIHETQENPNSIERQTPTIPTLSNTNSNVITNSLGKVQN
ncbi:hypothetical protein KA107_01235 [Candidatus Pacearchaeota archaeon]|nr:hypothetical protein [Candidatus Pacearchaeota archaeon]